MDCGHKTVKMKVGTDFATEIDYDVERVRLVRETIGPDAELAIDGNHSFTVQEGGLPLLACPLIATAGDDAMEEFLEVCNQPVLDCMEVTDRTVKYKEPTMTGPRLKTSGARSFTALRPDLLYNYLFSCYICY